ncbi:O-antigen ligase family protein [Galbibacter mesophilus]|uniref:O-antigen ligase family protein n=1 Tax=Galbibacter mesophilus TaxID=379069 RepID=UPI00191F47D6|nr:O-antigen ligase family protein [Galbibacter mesophilus]MCM5661368.1 O-antigen ligase family protein [Galbibacter mesophilus]
MTAKLQQIKGLFYRDENSTLWQRFFWNSLYIAFFLLPLDINYPTPFFILAIISGSINIFKGEKKYDPKNKVLLLFPVYFLVLLISMFYTENVADGWKLIQRSLSLLLFPIIFLFVKEDANSVRKLFDFLMYGLLVSFVINLGILITDVIQHLDSLDAGFSKLYYLEEIWTAFITSQFSSLVNPGYISLYILLVLSYYLKNEINNFYRFATVLVLFTYLFLLASKAAIIALFFMSILLIRKVKEKSKRFLLWLLFGLGIIVFVSNPRVINGVVSDTQEVNATISFQQRFLTWRAAAETIDEAPVLGYGIGDAHDALIAKYKELGFTENYKNRYNAHNQFLTTWLEAGVLGIFVLLTIFTCLAVYLRRSVNEFSVFLALFFALLFESMLVRFNGIVFFSIVVPLLLKERSILSSRVIRNS